MTLTVSCSPHSWASTHTHTLCTLFKYTEYLKKLWLNKWVNTGVLHCVNPAAVTSLWRHCSLESLIINCLLVMTCDDIAYVRACKHGKDKRTLVLLPLGEAEQFGLQLLPDTCPLLVQVHGRQADVSPVRVHHQARVRRWQQLGGGRERRDRARDRARVSARCRGHSGRLDRSTGGGHLPGHVHMFRVVFSMLEVRHTVWEERKSDDRTLPVWKRLVTACRHVVMSPPAGQEANNRQDTSDRPGSYSTLTNLLKDFIFIILLFCNKS